MAKSSATAYQNLTIAEVQERYSGGPSSGVFSDGCASPNPGPGGWGVVWVKDGEVVEHRHGHSPQTTNNRMEMTALIEALKMLPKDIHITIHTDSELCVNTLTKWAVGWQRNGWRRKSGPIANLELVQEAYRLLNERPGVKIQWIKAHSGELWNEYADSLANAWARKEL